MLDMGEPVRIVDVAKQLMEQSGRRVPITFTGLRDGEKMHEELFGDGEPHDVRPSHPLVSHVPVPPVLGDRIALLPAAGARDVVREAMARLCRELDGRAAPTVEPARSTSTPESVRLGRVA